MPADASSNRPRAVRRSAALALAVLLAAACRRSGVPAAKDPPPLRGDDVSGSWVHRETPMRYAESMTLAARGDTLAGEGTYAMEAGREGKTTIAGSRRGGVVTLAIVRDSGVRERWSGRLAGGKLAGELSIGGDRRPFGFERPPPE